jgi:DNA-binding MarR family transcriptional regulator
MDLTELSSSLRSTIAALHKGLRKQMSPVISYSMTEIETIGSLFRHKTLSPTDLASMTKVKTQSMSQILRKLEEDGIINRTPSKEDKRKVSISLTAFGKKMVEKTKYERDEWLKGAIQKSLTNKEIALLVKILPVLDKLALNK